MNCPILITLNNRPENNVTLNLEDTAGNQDEVVNLPNPSSQKSFCGNSQSSDSTGKVVSISI